MGTRKRTSARRWTFTSTREWLSWLEEEYLSEVTLDAPQPQPVSASAKRPAKGRATVRFTWVLHGTGNGARVPYRVVAHDVQTWSLEGVLGDRAIGLGAGDAEQSVHVIMQVPGTLTLRCGSLVITRGAALESVSRARPFTDYGYFRASGPQEPMVDEVLAAVGAPHAATWARDPRSLALRIFRQDVLWLLVHDLRDKSKPLTGFDFSIARGTTTDDEWHRIQELPLRLGATEIRSAWEFEGDTSAWMRAIGKNATEPVASEVERPLLLCPACHIRMRFEADEIERCPKCSGEMIGASDDSG